MASAHRPAQGPLSTLAGVRLEDDNWLLLQTNHLDSPPCWTCALLPPKDTPGVCSPGPAAALIPGSGLEAFQRVNGQALSCVLHIFFHVPFSAFCPGEAQLLSQRYCKCRPFMTLAWTPSAPGNLSSHSIL